MTFISYAQNFEDVMLWRALKHIEHGFYIDIGAWSPDLDSVTKAFYERGWRGINIEPNPELFRQLQERRPQDKNLRVAVGDREGAFTMNFLSNTGLSTLDDAIAEKHLQAGYGFERQEVQVTTLAAIWQKHVPAKQDVHFLKVDVEGFEAAILRTNDWPRYRPWIVVGEATLPMSQTESHESWEPALVAAGYHFAYADGLNRFYVANEHLELLSAFKYPPNVFDGFLLSRQEEAEARAIQAEACESEARAEAQKLLEMAQHAHARVVQVEAGANEIEVALEAVRKELHDVHQANHHHWQLAEARQQQIQALLNSTSWRITFPLRWGASALRSLHPNALRPHVKVFLQHTALYVGRHPRLKNAALSILNRFPSLKVRLRQIVIGIPPIQEHVVQAQRAPTALAELTPHARRIYTDLKSAIERRHKKQV